jgi:hypothetical protein
MRLNRRGKRPYHSMIRHKDGTVLFESKLSQGLTLMLAPARASSCPGPTSGACAGPA